MKDPQEFWRETPTETQARVEKQNRDRAALVDDWTELVYSADLDELYAELLRLHRLVGDTRTEELARRIFPDRIFPSAAELA